MSEITTVFTPKQMLQGYSDLHLTLKSLWFLWVAFKNHCTLSFSTKRLYSMNPLLVAGQTERTPYT